MQEWYEENIKFEMCINVREEQGDNKWGRIRELMRVKESKKKREGVLINSYQNM